MGGGGALAGVHTSVRTAQGPGGRSALGAVGGLGAFMYGDADDEPEPEPVPRHQRMQVRWRGGPEGTGLAAGGG